MMYLYRQITANASAHLLSAVSSWSALEHLHLSNISFPIPLTLPSPSSDPLSIPPLLPKALSKLKTITLTQATALSPGSIAAFLSLPGTRKLRRIHLVDTYEVSIWGKRLRRADVEKAAERLSQAIGEGGVIVETRVARVKEVVLCEARLERIIGGDRVEGEMRVLE